MVAKSMCRTLWSILPTSSFLLRCPGRNSSLRCQRRLALSAKDASEDVELTTCTGSAGSVFVARRRKPATHCDGGGWADAGHQESSATPSSPSSAPDLEGGHADSPVLEVPLWQIPELVTNCHSRPPERLSAGTEQRLILTHSATDLLGTIVSELPTFLRFRPMWYLGYSTMVDGMSLSTLFRMLQEIGPCVLVVEDTGGFIFGAFLDTGIRCRPGYPSMAEGFLFRYPAELRGTQTYATSGCGSPASQAVADSPRRACASDGCEVGLSLYTGRSPTSSTHARGHALTEDEVEARATMISVAQEGSRTMDMAACSCGPQGLIIGIDGPGLFIAPDLRAGLSRPSVAFGSQCLAATEEFNIRKLEVWHWDADV